MATSIQPDRQEIYRAIDLLIADGDVFEIRVLNTGRTGTARGYFDDIDAAVDAAAAWSGKAPSIYVTLNPVNPALLARAANRMETYAKTSTLDPDIVRRRWLLIDIDPKRPSGISSSDEEHEAALTVARVIYQFLKMRKWPEPIMADSGNGAHLLYRVDLPNDDESRDLIQAVLQALARKFSDEVIDVDTGNFNAARISKLYGTAVCKGDSVPARPHRLSRILNYDDFSDELGSGLVHVEQLRSLVADLPKPKEAEKPAPTSHARGRADDRPDYFASVNDRAMENLLLWVPQMFPAAKPYNGGFRVKSKDLNRPNEEDLTIMPQGIVDYGVADQGDPRQGRRTPIDLVIEYRGGDATEAAHWLAQQMGYSPESLGWRSSGQKSAPTSRARAEQSAESSSVDEPAPVTDLVEIKKLRLGFEDRIKASDDVDELSVVIAREVQNSTLPEQTRLRLLGLIAKKTELSKAELVKSLRPPKASSNQQPDEPDEDTIEEFIADLNERHAVVMLGGRAYIMNKDYDPGLDRPLLSFSSSKDFVLRYRNRKIGYGPFATTHGEYWLDSPKRRQYEGVVFIPGRTIPGYYNLFQGFGVTPKRGCYARIQEFLLEIICNGNEELFDYLWCWCAHMVQQPDELPGVALVFRSPEEGTGKNTLVEKILSVMIGRQHFIQLSSMHQVTGRFSGHLADLLLVHCNEAIWGGDKNAEGILKGMITDPVETIERKNQDAISVPNYKRIIISTNNDWPISRGHTDRRFVVFDISNREMGNRDYYGRIYEEIEKGGIEALMHALMEVDITQWRPSQIPNDLRQLGWDIKIQSGSTVLKWWFGCLQSAYIIGYNYGQFPGDSDQAVWPTDMEMLKEGQMVSQSVYKAYLRWCKELSIYHPVHSVNFTKELKRWGVITTRARYGSPQHCYKIPTLEQSRVLFAQCLGLPDECWEADEVT